MCEFSEEALHGDSAETGNPIEKARRRTAAARTFGQLDALDLASLHQVGGVVFCLATATVRLPSAADGPVDAPPLAFRKSRIAWSPVISGVWPLPLREALAFLGAF